MSVSLSDRERTALIAVAAASPNRPADGAVPAVNGVQLRTALRQAGFRTTSVQGAHQAAASLVRKGLVVKDYGPGGVRYGPLTVDGTEALPAAGPYHVRRLRTSEEPLHTAHGPLTAGSVRYSRTFPALAAAIREAAAWRSTGGWKTDVVPGKAPPERRRRNP
jgi:hypothetical protein